MSRDLKHHLQYVLEQCKILEKDESKDKNELWSNCQRRKMFSLHLQIDACCDLLEQVGFGNRVKSFCEKAKNLEEAHAEFQETHTLFSRVGAETPALELHKEVDEILEALEPDKPNQRAAAGGKKISWPNTLWGMLNTVLDTWMGNVDDAEERKKIFQYYNATYAGKPKQDLPTETYPVLSNLGQLGNVIRNRRKSTKKNTS